MPCLNTLGVSMSHPAKTEANQFPDMIRSILQDMDACISAQERIIIEERDAMKVFDAEALAELVERRARIQSIFHELESRCQRLLGLSDRRHTMEYLIDHYASDDADMLQTMRVDLMRRMQVLEEEQTENHLRLRAAWNVTTGILQHIGVAEMPQTYTGQGYAAAQGSR